MPIRRERMCARPQGTGGSESSAKKGRGQAAYTLRLLVIVDYGIKLSSFLLTILTLNRNVWLGAACKN